MKSFKSFLMIGLIVTGLFSCKMLAKGAAKWWTKKQIAEFVENCESKSGMLMSDEKAKKYCNCAVDKVAEEYHDFNDVKKKGILTVLKIAKGCK
ncbi:MAG: hypothetical protein ACI857_000726 [Arenicella sp.]|jgi:hypothetical protein